MKREIRDLYYSVVPRSSYLKFTAGNTNILITAPHGGGMKPVSIPRRKYGQKLMDTYTRRLTSKLIGRFPSHSSPSFLISDIHRSRVDLNRDIEEGAQGNKRAEKIWKEWDSTILGVQSWIKTNYTYGVYIDIHSHNDGDYFELGYNLSARNYRALYENGYTTYPTTIDTLYGKPYEMIFGYNSFRQGLRYYGYKDFFPTGNEVYFNGGRNIEVYSGFGIGAIQIECPVSILKKDLNGVADFLFDQISLFTRKFANRFN